MQIIQHYFLSQPPAIVNVPSRQFTVQTHFNKVTPENYILAAEKKVRQIHKRLPPGGILVFVTGQEEVKTLCNKLRKQCSKKNGTLLRKLKKKISKNSIDLPEIDLDNLPKVTSQDVEEASENDEEEDDEDLDNEEELEPLHVIPLYSMLPSAEQQKVRKIWNIIS